MSKVLFISIVVFYSLSIHAQLANHIVIAEIYGGGGNSGSYWQYDYIVLYNPTSSSLDLSNWSIQYTSASGTNWSITNLSGNIESGSYFMIREDQGTGGVDTLPVISNVVGTININATAGKVALVNNQDEISGFMDTDIIDFVGFGNSASDFEGSGPTPAPSNINCVRRKDNSGSSTYGINGSGWDSDNNNNDFYTALADTSNLPMPVELTSFTASVFNNQIHLNWETATEVNNYGFEIERTVESKDNLWNKIGFAEGNGNSNSSKQYQFIDYLVTSGSYLYRLKQIDSDGSYSYSKTIEVTAGTVKDFALEQNYPNPFNPSTKIKFVFEEITKAELKVFDVLGNEVANLFNRTADAGRIYEIDFVAANLPSGVYYYRLSGNNKTEIKKMLLLK